MAILGLYDGHNSCAAVVSDTNGEIIAAVEEERFSRIKNHDSRIDGIPMPLHSIQYCLAESTEPITCIALALEEPTQLARRAINTFLDSVIGGETARLACQEINGISLDGFDLLQHPLRTQRSRVSRCIAALADCGLSVDSIPIVHVPHHTAHAASTFLCAPTEDALILTLDGKGDGLSGLVAHGTSTSMTLHSTMDYMNSLGHLYMAFTAACGFKPGSQEGKVTALAAHSMADEELYHELSSIYWLDEHEGYIRGELSKGLKVGPYPHTLYAHQLDRVRAIIGTRDAKTAAATIQMFVEDLIVTLADYHIQRTGVTTLAVAGGLFANVSVNRRLSTLCGPLFIHPAMSDAGLAVGAATHAFAVRTQRRPRPLQTAFLGPEYQQVAAIEPFRSAGFEVQSDVNPEAYLAGALARGEIVARFFGRAEYGPRALGNRSIFAPTTDPALPANLNARLRRSGVMPFAPMSVAEDADNLYECVTSVLWSAKYMTVALKCRRQMIEQSPAAVHVDGTARPQLVRSDENERLHTLICQYRHLTGVPSIINTSLNMHEEPMVLTPTDAVRCVTEANIETVQVGDLICRRKGSNLTIPKV